MNTNKKIEEKNNVVPKKKVKRFIGRLQVILKRFSGNSYYAQAMVYNTETQMTIFTAETYEIGEEIEIGFALANKNMIVKAQVQENQEFCIFSTGRLNRFKSFVPKFMIKVDLRFDSEAQKQDLMETI
jgi:hypothetical protein